MKRIRSIIGALLICVAFPTVYLAPVVVTQTGCRTLHGDPVVINAERAIKLGFELCDAFVTYEHLNNQNGELGQAVRRAADDVRRQAPTWIRVANAMLDNYQAAMAVAKTAASAEREAANARVKSAQLALTAALKTLEDGKDKAARELSAAQKGQ